MIEWKVRRPKVGTIRIEKKACLFPRRMGDTYVWLDYRYIFQQYREYEDSDYMASNEYYYDWDSEIVMSPTEYKKFISEVGTHLTSNDLTYRKYAQFISKENKNV